MGQVRHLVGVGSMHERMIGLEEGGEVSRQRRLVVVVMRMMMRRRIEVLLWLVSLVVLE